MFQDAYLSKIHCKIGLTQVISAWDLWKESRFSDPVLKPEATISVLTSEEEATQIRYNFYPIYLLYVFFFSEGTEGLLTRKRLHQKSLLWDTSLESMREIRALSYTWVTIALTAVIIFLTLLTRITRRARTRTPLGEAHFLLFLAVQRFALAMGDSWKTLIWRHLLSIEVKIFPILTGLLIPCVATGVSKIAGTVLLPQTKSLRLDCVAVASKNRRYRRA